MRLDRTGPDPGPDPIRPVARLLKKSATIGWWPSRKGSGRFSLVLSVPQGISQFSRGIHRRFILASPDCAIFATHDCAKHEK